MIRNWQPLSEDEQRMRRPLDVGTVLSGTSEPVLHVNVEPLVRKRVRYVTLPTDRP